RDVAERPDLGAPRLPAREHEVLQRATLTRVHAKAARRVLYEDLTGRHAVDGTASVRRTIPASVRTKAGSSFGISIRSSLTPSSRASPAASTSRSQRISR